MVEPGAAIFQSLRLRLTLLYAAMLGLALVLVGAALLFALRVRVMGPVDAMLRTQIGFQVQLAQRPGMMGCPIRPTVLQGPPRPRSVPVSVACFEVNGELAFSGFEPPDVVGTPGGPFLEPSLVAQALRDREAQDWVEDETGLPMARLAVPLHDPRTGAVQSVIQVGVDISQEVQTLDTVRNLLLGLGGLAVLLALGGGWLLSRRALAPARLAFARQQSFIADASHELRTPMALLRANAEVLLRHRDRLATDYGELLEDIVTETEHMGRLTADLLTLARLDADGAPPEREVVDLNALAEGLVRRVRAAAEARGLAVEVEPGERVLTLADADGIEQAGLILLENALKYTPPGGRVRVCSEAVGELARLTVTDSGVGIAPEHLARLGERFFRADKSRSRETGGSGLGLAIAFRIAAAHGGRVELTSEPGSGTTATISLPLLREGVRS